MNDMVYIAMAAFTSILAGYLFYKYSGFIEDDEGFGFWAFGVVMSVLFSIAIGLIWFFTLPVMALLGLLKLAWKAKHGKERHNSY